VVILKAAAGEPIPLYGDGLNVRDWLYVEDHVDALLLAGAPHNKLITPVADRPGHDRRYAIDPTRISSELGWQPRHSFEEGLAASVAWYLKHQGWCEQVRQQGGYAGGRLGLLHEGFRYWRSCVKPPRERARRISASISASPAMTSRPSVRGHSRQASPIRP
jgi:hypothetical protein